MLVTFLVLYTAYIVDPLVVHAVIRQAHVIRHAHDLLQNPP